MARLAPRLLIVALGAVAPLAAQSAPSAKLEVSDNPVRGNQVVITWPAGVGTAHVAVYAFTGEQIDQTSVSAPSNQYTWDLTAGGGARRVVNGAYIVVVNIDGRHYRRRLFIARPPSP